MSNLNIFCFGFGQVAKTFIQKLKLENFNINLSATSRKKTHTLKFNNINYTSFQFEGDDYDIELIKNLEKTDLNERGIDIKKQNWWSSITQNIDNFVGSVFKYIGQKK